MITRSWMPALSTLGAALLLSSCAASVPGSDDADAEVSPQEDPPETSEVVADAGDGEPGEEVPGAPTSTAAPAEDDDAVHRGGLQLVIGPDAVEFLHVSAEDDDGTEIYHLHCQDDEALAAKAAHNDGAQPAGWPQDWDGTGAMPDPLCHPDYLEIEEWEYLEAHTACWEGIETSTLVRHGQSQEEVDRDLWQQSRARADWAPNPPGGTCAEQWAENDGG